MLTIVMPFHREEEMAKMCLLMLKERSSQPYPVMIVDSAPNTTNLQEFLFHWLGWGSVRYIEAAGSTPGGTLARGLALAETPFVVFLHQDTMLLEQDWDLRLLERMSSDPDLVLCGLFGFQLYSKGFTDRAGWRGSNMVEAEHHGERLTGFREASGVDGFFMAMRRGFYEGRVDPELRFNFYDYDLSLQAIVEGKKVGVLGIYCHHNRAAARQPGPVESQYLQTKWSDDPRVQELHVA